MLRKAIIPILLLVSVVCVLYLQLGEMVLHPNRYMLNGLSDGLKNYYTPMYYINNDSGWWFTGMNYPYGEHVIYTDNQPFISWCLNLLNKVIPISNYTVGIINLLMYFSLWLCAWFLFLILNKQLRLPTFYALVFSLLITFLSPQIARWTGHYALAYCCFFPMVWYYLIKLQQSKNMLAGTLSLLAVCVCFGFIHLYYLLIGAIFLLAYWFVFAIENRKITSKVKKRSAFLLITALAPLVIVRLIISLSDPVIDRPSAPFGILFYRSFLETVFLPVYGPVKKLILNAFNYSTDRIEGHAYIGLVGLIVALFTLFRLIYKLIKRDFRFQFTQNKVLNQSLKAAILTLLFSMGIPFIWGMEFLLDLLPPLKQFRSLGRFAWIFYYVFTVFTAYTIYLWFRMLTIKNKPLLTIILLLGVVGVWSVENYIHVRETKWRIRPVENCFSNTSTDYLKILENEGYTPDEFQAILALPYFHIGSEKMGIHRDEMAFLYATELSIKTGLPIIQSHMSRASISQTNKAIQLISDTLIPKTIISELPNRKPLLLVVANIEYFASETNIIDHAKLIYQPRGLRLLELPLSAFDTTLSKETLSADYHKPMLWNSFEKNTQLNCYSGKGSFYKKEGDIEFFSWNLPKEDSLSLEVSFWIYIEPTVYGMPEVEFQFLKDGKLVRNSKTNTQLITDIDNNWLKVTEEIEVTNKLDELKIIVKGNPYWIDDLMIRRKDKDAFVRIGDKTKKNNFTVLE